MLDRMKRIYYIIIIYLAWIGDLMRKAQLSSPDVNDAIEYPIVSLQ